MAILFGAGKALWVFEQPDAGAPAREIVAFYTSISGRIEAGASLSLVGGAVFVLFASDVRAILREREGDDLLATTAFGGALLLAAAGLGAETLNMVGALRLRPLDPRSDQAARRVSPANADTDCDVTSIASCRDNASDVTPATRPSRNRATSMIWAAPVGCSVTLTPALQSRVSINTSGRRWPTKSASSAV